MKSQPKCCKERGGCNHSISFHNGRVGQCYAFGCQCRHWVAAKPTKKKTEPTAA